MNPTMLNLSNLKQLAYQMRRDNPNRDLEDCSQDETIKMVGAYLQDAPGDAGELLEYIDESMWSHMGDFFSNLNTRLAGFYIAKDMALAFTTVPNFKDTLHNIQAEVDAEIEREDRNRYQPDRDWETSV